LVEFNRDLIKKLTEEAYSETVKKKITQQNTLKQVAQNNSLGQLSTDKSAVRLPNGEKYLAAISGSPDEIDNSIKVSSKHAMVVNDNRTIIRVGTKKAKIYVIYIRPAMLDPEDPEGQAYLQYNRAYVIDLDEPDVKYEMPFRTPPELVVPGDDPFGGTGTAVGAAFSPNGNHIAIGWGRTTGPAGVGSISGWTIYSNWSIHKDESDQPIFSYERVNSAMFPADFGLFIFTNSANGNPRLESVSIAVEPIRSIYFTRVYGEPGDGSENTPEVNSATDGANRVAVVPNLFRRDFPLGGGIEFDTLDFFWKGGPGVGHSANDLQSFTYTISGSIASDGHYWIRTGNFATPTQIPDEIWADVAALSTYDTIVHKSGIILATGGFYPSQVIPRMIITSDRTFKGVFYNSGDDHFIVANFKATPSEDHDGANSTVVMKNLVSKPVPPLSEDDPDVGIRPDRVLAFYSIGKNQGTITSGGPESTGGTGGI